MYHTHKTFCETYMHIKSNNKIDTCVPTVQVNILNIRSLSCARWLITLLLHQETTSLIFVFIPLIFFIVFPFLKVSLNNIVWFWKTSPNLPLSGNSSASTNTWRLPRGDKLSLDPVSLKRSHLGESVGTVLGRFPNTVGITGQGCFNLVIQVKNIWQKYAGG